MTRSEFRENLVSCSWKTDRTLVERLFPRRQRRVLTPIHVGARVISVDRAGPGEAKSFLHLTKSSHRHTGQQEKSWRKGFFFQTLSRWILHASSSINALLFVVCKTKTYSVLAWSIQKTGKLFLYGKKCCRGRVLLLKVSDSFHEKTSFESLPEIEEKLKCSLTWNDFMKNNVLVTYFVCTSSVY